MDGYLLFTVLAQNDVSGIKTSTDLSGLLIPAIVIIVTIIAVIFIAAILKIFLSSRKVTLDWSQFEDQIQKIQLTPEEASFLRTHLRKLRYTAPLEVLKKEGEFDRFYKKVLRRPNHHHDYLLQMVRKKAFTGHVASKSASPASKESPVSNA